MPQAGFHGIVGVAARKWMPAKEWLFLGVVLGNLFPDLDNIAVAYATITKSSTEGLHRTFTHSFFTIIALVILFYIIGALTKNQKWNNFGLGFGAGILMHILLDLVAWFNGVELFWPIRYELNFWSWFVMPNWLNILLQSGEFLAFGLFFYFLVSAARRQKTDEDYAPKLKGWGNIQLALFVLFTVLFFLPQKGITTIFGAVYLLSLIFAIVMTIRMRKTVESI
jgi:membrane-bound metal-dependent hydrolase YbcI (DUF457 family)